MEDNNYETKTNLLSCEDVVAYLWNKCDKISSPFKPEGAKTIETSVVYADIKTGELIKRDYVMLGTDARHMGLRNETEYEVDTVSFQTKNEEGEVISDGTLLVIYKSTEKYYGIFLLEEKEGVKNLKLLVKCTQKKKMFQSFPTEAILYY